MKMTMKKVINETCHTDHERSLFRAVIRQIGCWEEVWDCPENFRDASGGITGFINCRDTHRFAKKTIESIVYCLNEFEAEIGEPLRKDSRDLLNWYAWFALEHIIDRIMMYKESLDND